MSRIKSNARKSAKTNQRRNRKNNRSKAKMKAGKGAAARRQANYLEKLRLRNHKSLKNREATAMEKELDWFTIDFCQKKLRIGFSRLKILVFA